MATLRARRLRVSQIVVEVHLTNLTTTKHNYLHGRHCIQTAGFYQAAIISR